MTRIYSAYRRFSSACESIFDSTEQAIWDAVVQELERFHP